MVSHFIGIVHDQRTAAKRGRAVRRPQDFAGNHWLAHGQAAARAAADRVVGTNDQGGVAQAIGALALND